VLAALSDVADTDRGAAHLKAAIEAKSSPAARSATMSLLGGGGTGRDDALLDEELGRRSWAISDDVARATGIGRESAHKLLGGVTSVALLAIAKTGTPTDPNALRALLHQESKRGETLYTAPEHAGHHMGPPIRQLESPRRSWWLLAAGLALAAIIAIPLARGVMRNRQASIAPAPVVTQPAPAPKAAAPEPAPAPAEPQTAAPTPAPTPAEPAAGVPAEEPKAAAPAEEPKAAAPAEEPQAAAPEPAAEPTFAADSPVSELAAFLGSDEGAVPRTFALEPLNFATGSSEPTEASVATIDELAEALRVYPSAEIALESHTDSTGTASANEALANARSESVKEMLVGRGIDEGRISTTGRGQNAPLDTNATSEGRAANRRTEVTVTSK
jgi:outer membrane protein OmpA-like peptidoglycan-associated protein